MSLGLAQWVKDLALAKAAAMVQIQSLAQKLPFAMDATIKTKKKWLRVSQGVIKTHN